MENSNAFVQRLLKHLPKSSPSSYRFDSWSVSGKATKEGFGFLPAGDVDADSLIARVMDVNHYVGHIDYVEECRSIEDDRFSPPEQVRFYQRLKIPVLGSVHHELVLKDLGEVEGYRIAYWEMLSSETNALNKKKGFRSEYNDGAWLVGHGCVGYALSSAPLRGDVGFLKYKAMTKGADVGASAVVKANIEGMIKWSKG